MKKSHHLLVALFVAVSFWPDAARAQNLYVGSNTPSNTLNLTSDTNSYVETYIGFSAGSDGNALTVANPGTLLTNSNDLYVGNEGSGNSLTISNGGAVNNLLGRVGSAATSSNNSVLVTDTGSLWTTRAVLYIGESGSGNSLVVSNAGTVASLDSSTLGYNSTSGNNSALVTGVGSVWSVTNGLSSFYVGYEGSSNSLTISDGGTVASRLGRVGLGTNSVGNSVLVTGSGSLWTNSDDTFIGEAGSGNSLIISNGGTVASTEQTSIGFLAEARSNSAVVTGIGSSWSVSNNGLIVGNVGSDNSLVISDGAVVSGLSSILGQNAGSSNNIATVTGSGSQWNATGSLTVGSAGAGNSLVISNGGAASSTGDSRIGFSTGTSNNIATITGAGSQWNAGGTFIVGNRGPSNSLVVSDGATVTSANGEVGGNTAAANSLATITGTGSQWNAGNTLLVGRRGTGAQLVVSNGGLVSSAAGFVGFSNTVTNSSALITGAGSQWTNSGTLTVGHRGSNSVLTVTEGGTIAAANVVIASSNGSTGTLNIGRFGTNDASGTVNAASIAFGAGVGALNFNQSNNLTVSLPISGAGTVNQLGTATTTLEGTNTYTGGTLVSGGVLRGSSTSVQGSITNNASVVFNQATDGTYAGAMTGSGTVDKIGGGTLTVTGASSYSGGTALQAGALVVNGAVSNSIVTAASGTTLAGSGSVGGIVLNLGSTVSPGNSPGTLTSLGNVVWNPGANYNWQIHDAAPGGAGQPTGWDLINVTGILDLTALSIGSEFNINLWSLSGVSPDANGNAINFDNTQSYTWTILTASNGITGFSADKFNINTAAFNGAGGFANALGGGTISIQQSGYDLNLVFNPAGGPSPVPEPGTWAAAALLAGGAAFMRWRKRRAKDS